MVRGKVWDQEGECRGLRDWFVMHGWSDGTATATARCRPLRVLWLIWYAFFLVCIDACCTSCGTASPAPCAPRVGMLSLGPADYAWLAGRVHIRLFTSRNYALHVCHPGYCGARGKYDDPEVVQAVSETLIALTQFLNKQLK